MLDPSGLAVDGYFRHHGMAVSILYPWRAATKNGAAVALKGEGTQPGPGGRASWSRRLTPEI